MVKIFQFTPSSADYENVSYVIAESKEDAINILKTKGYKDSDLTSDYNISDYADCFQLEEVNSINVTPCVIFDKLETKFKIDDLYVSENEYIVFKQLNCYDFKTLKEIKEQYPKFDNYISDIVQLNKNRLHKVIENYNDILVNINNYTFEQITNLVSKNRARKYNLETLKNIIIKETSESILIETKSLNELNSYF